MASWHYAFFFPASRQRLDAANAVQTLVQSGFEVTEPVRRLVPIDDDGHLGEYGEEISLNQSHIDNLCDRLRKGEQLFVEFSKHDVASNIVTTLACSFETKTANPHFSFGWHKRLFGRLSPETQQEFWLILRNVAKQSNSGYVILADEASDTFEDRFLEIDGTRVLDTEVHHHYGHGIWAVWVDNSVGAMCPEGVADVPTAYLGEGFVQYGVE